MVELLPCPFCNSKARLVKKEGYGPAGGKFSRGYVACNKCGVSTPTKSPWQKAVHLWNRPAHLPKAFKEEGDIWSGYKEDKVYSDEGLEDT